MDNVFSNLLIYFLDQNIVDALGISKPNLNDSKNAFCKQVLDKVKEKDKERLKNWYIKYAKLYLVKEFGNQKNFKSFSLRINSKRLSDIDTQLGQYTKEKIFVNHYDKVFKMSLISVCPGIRKYIENAQNENFYSLFFSYVSSPECIRMYSQQFSSETKYDIAMFSDLKTKMDILDPSTRNSSQILSNYIISMAIRKSSFNRSNLLVVSVAQNVISEILKGLKKDKDNAYYSLFKEILSVYNLEKGFNILVQIILNIQTKYDDIVLKYIAPNAEQSEGLLIQEAVNLGVSPKLLENPKFRLFLGGLFAVVQGFTFVYSIINYDHNNNYFNFDPTIFYTNVFSVFVQTIQLGAESALAVFSEALAGTKILSSALKTISQGFPGVFRQVFGVNSVKALIGVSGLLGGVFFGLYLYELIKNPPKGGWGIAISLLEGFSSLLFLVSCFFPTVGIFAMVVGAIVMIVSTIYMAINILSKLGIFDTLFNFLELEYLISNQEYIEACKAYIKAELISDDKPPITNRDCVQLYLEKIGGIDNLGLVHLFRMECFGYTGKERAQYLNII